ncbi:translation initiation factor IF-2-like [Vulpes lagopus]|uniref:translation initiation factor IF-2-like n=1 Tax=Vulpes lagopus TaxID=494514 RepID=UPI001BCA53BD|nr:translation initiation factor IF-2-like [Vulpes lagopus]
MKHELRAGLSARGVRVPVAHGGAEVEPRSPPPPPPPARKRETRLLALPRGVHRFPRPPGAPRAGSAEERAGARAGAGAAAGGAQRLDVARGGQAESAAARGAGAVSGDAGARAGRLPAPGLGARRGRTAARRTPAGSPGGQPRRAAPAPPAPRRRSGRAWEDEPSAGGSGVGLGARARAQTGGLFLSARVAPPTTPRCQILIPQTCRVPELAERLLVPAWPLRKILFLFTHERHREREAETLMQNLIPGPQDHDPRQRQMLNHGATKALREEFSTHVPNKALVSDFIKNAYQLVEDKN